MNNLHRELAPISDAAWAQIEEEASRTLKRYLAARRVVDVEGPQGTTLSAVGTGHLSKIEAPAEGILARQRIVKPVVELRVPFELDRQQIDDVERGANDSDWQPVKDAARRIAFAEDRAVFEGYPAGGIEGVSQGTSNPIMTLPTDLRDYPDVIAQALSQLRLVGVNGPYSVLLSADAYTGLSETRDHGYPVLEHIKRLVNSEIIWAPAIAGGFVLTTRGGDFDLHIGQDVSIGYSSHTDAAVTLYLQETFTFLLLTSEAAVALAPPNAVNASAEEPATRQLITSPRRDLLSPHRSGSFSATSARFPAPSHGQARRARPGHQGAGNSLREWPPGFRTGQRRDDQQRDERRVRGGLRRSDQRQQSRDGAARPSCVRSTPPPATELTEPPPDRAPREHLPAMPSPIPPGGAAATLSATHPAPRPLPATSCWQGDWPRAARCRRPRHMPTSQASVLRPCQSTAMPPMW